MRRTFLLVVGTGIGAILLAAYLAVVDPTPVSPEEPLDVALLVAIGLLGAGTWRLWNARRGIAGRSGDRRQHGRPPDRPAGRPRDGTQSGPSGRPRGGPPDGPTGGLPGSAPGGPGEGPDGGPAGGSAGGPADGSTGGPATAPSGQGPGASESTEDTDDGSRVEADQGGTSRAEGASIAGGMVARAPERTPLNQPIAGDYLARLTEDACRVASQEGRVEPGVAVVRPPLREATRAVLVRSGLDVATATARLDSGEWTEDRLAASVLSREVVPPPVPLRKRLRRWLFPERVVRERIARAVDAMAGTAEARLPTVVGQNAPRPVPVAPSTLEDRQRHPDGSLRRGPPEAGPRRGGSGAHGRARTPAREDRRWAGHERTGRGEPGQGRTGRGQDGDRKPGDEPAKDDDRDGPGGRNAGQGDGV